MTQGMAPFTESVNINSQTLTISSTQAGMLAGCTTTVCGAEGVLATFAQQVGGYTIQSQINTAQNYSTGDDLLSQTEVDALFGGGVTTVTVSLTTDVYEYEEA